MLRSECREGKKMREEIRAFEPKSAACFGRRGCERVDGWKRVCAERGRARRARKGGGLRCWTHPCHQRNRQGLTPARYWSMLCARRARAPGLGGGDRHARAAGIVGRKKGRKEEREGTVAFTIDTTRYFSQSASLPRVSDVCGPT